MYNQYNHGLDCKWGFGNKKTNILGGSDKHFQNNLISKLQSTILQW